MISNIVITYCYQSVILSHGYHLHPFDEKGCTLHSLSVYTRGFHHSDETDEI